MATYSYENLEVRKKSINLSIVIYDLTKKDQFSKDFWLSNQIQRSSVSIASNIAEWSMKWTKNEFIHWCRIAKWSLAELHTQVIIAHKIWYITDAEFITIENDITILMKQINALISSLKS